MQKFNYRQAGKPRPGLSSGKYPPCSVGNLKTDIPSHTVGEVEELGRKLYTGRYTLTHSEGRLSVYADFSHLKYLVMQFAQKPFTILVTYLICRKNIPAYIICRKNKTKNKKKERKLFSLQKIWLNQIFIYVSATLPGISLASNSSRAELTQVPVRP
mgnify:CR=1 FL=1